jgi:hypothetical protein
MMRTLMFLVALVYGTRGSPGMAAVPVCAGVVISLQSEIPRTPASERPLPATAPGPTVDRLIGH